LATPADLLQVQAAIAADMLLGKLRLRPGRGEPPYVQSLRELLKKLDRSQGKDSLDALAPAVRQYFHCLVDALADRVTGVEQESTVDKVKALPIEYRLGVESMIAGLTGANTRDKRWNSEIYSIKKYVEDIVLVSISDITAAEIRQGFDPLIHAVVDKICDNWRTLIN
jgi:hypothetical protein